MKLPYQFDNIFKKVNYYYVDFFTCSIFFQNQNDTLQKFTFSASEAYLAKSTDRKFQVLMITVHFNLDERILN